VFLVDQLPFLRHIPKWLPGAAFKRKAEMWKRSLNESCDKPWDIAQREFGTVYETPSAVTSWLSGLSSQPDHKDRDSLTNALKYVSGSALLAGYDIVRYCTRKV